MEAMVETENRFERVGEGSDYNKFLSGCLRSSDDD